MQTLTQPTLLLKPFADSGDKNALPNVNTDASNPQRADLTNGFPQITGLLPSQGGLPPERKDFNALGYLTTTYDYFYQAGGVFTFDSTISSAIGGYPLNARLWYTNSNGQSMILRSTKQNNTSNFNSGVGIGTDWVIESFIGVGLNEGYVSNCITKIPQNIKLELNNGTLTLKSGSIVTLPDGSEYQTTADITFTQTSAGQYFIYLNKSTTPWVGTPQATFSYVNKTVSGTTDSLSGEAYHVWYDTANNLIKRYSSDTSTPSGYCCFPLAMVTVSGGSISSINQVFNGAGYIGSSFFVLPGMTGLCPNGRNTDGTLASIISQQAQLRIYNPTGTNSGVYGVQAANGGIGAGKYFIQEKVNANGRTYIPSLNRVYQANGTEQASFPIVKFSTSSGAITEFEVLQPFHDVSYTDVLNMNNEFRGINTVPTPAAGDNSQQIANTTWVRSIVNSLVMPDYSAGVAKTHGTSYQAETNLLFCYSCDSAEYVESSIEVSSDGITWIQVGLHKTAGGGGNDQENVGQIFVPKDWYYRANGGGSSLCVAFPLIGG